MENFEAAIGLRVKLSWGERPRPLYPHKPVIRSGMPEEGRMTLGRTTLSAEISLGEGWKLRWQSSQQLRGCVLQFLVALNSICDRYLNSRYVPKVINACINNQWLWTHLLILMKQGWHFEGLLTYMRQKTQIRIHPMWTAITQKRYALRIKAK